MKYKPYDPSIKPKYDPIQTKVAVIKHLKTGMAGEVYEGTLISGEGTFTITIRALGLSISVPVEAIQKTLDK